MAIPDTNNNSEDSLSNLYDDVDDYLRLRDFEDYLFENFTSPTVQDL